MTQAEILAFNAGINAVREIAKAAAQVLAQHDTRPQAAFAITALLAIADEARALLIPETKPTTDAGAVNGPTS